MALLYVSIGSNVEREQNIRAAVAELRATFTGVRVSRVYESEPVGMIADNFYNLVAAAHTDLPVREVARRLAEIESKRGRVRGSARFVPRTLDLDLLLFDDLVCASAGVTLPRPEITEYAFVLLPLAELAPDARHPELRKTYRQMWAEFPRKGQRLWPIEFAWEVNAP
jgi:2-amino-4-hydroxy-6-hydroxymethyldihydropteridine diphosphokinase